ncbi:hypothetical protein QFC21_006407 [Naganishia friedmannii]|uniref:Uncharacterized protein n=1 Tax=Naganishia friedmannii TaxID=89922 RepID=A0ACC2V447_9TREE|nr:hypothetical protein QFC21_006407 [Naganishia friedmannii]
MSDRRSKNAKGLAVKKIARQLRKRTLAREMPSASRNSTSTPVKRDTYVMSSKAGSLPVSIRSSQVTGSNIYASWLAEHSSIRADVHWLPDLCVNSPVIKQVVTSGQSILFPLVVFMPSFGCTVEDSLALSGA